MRAFASTMRALSSAISNRLIDDLHAARERLLDDCSLALNPNADTNDDADVIDLTD